MKNSKLIGLLLLVLAVLTIVCMVINNNACWSVYNYIMFIISLPSGIVLLKQK